MRLIDTGVEPHKFWEITRAGTETTTRYGREGKKGRTRKKAHKSEAAAKRYVAEKVEEKQDKGYRFAAQAKPRPAPKAATPGGPASSRWWEQGAPDGAVVVGALERKVLACHDAEGRLHGPMTLFEDRAGQRPTHELNWAHGVPHGRHLQWAGDLWRSGAFDQGAPDGRWTMSFQTTPIHHLDFDKGALTSVFTDKVVGLSRRPVALVLSVNRTPVASFDDVLAAGADAKEVYIAGYPEEAFPAGLWDLTQLEKITITGCGIRALSPGIARLTRLTTLDINSTPLKALPIEVGALPELGFLRVQNTLLESCPPLANPKLTNLSLPRNRLLAVEHALSSCPALYAVDLGHNYIVSLDDKLFSAPALKSVNAGGSWAAWIAPDVARAQHLELLELNTQGVPLLPDALRECGALSTVLVNGAKLAAPPWCLDARALKKLNVVGCPFTELPGGEDFEAKLDLAWDAHRTPKARAHATAAREEKQRRAETERARTEAALARQREEARLNAIADDLLASGTGLEAPPSIDPIPTREGTDRWRTAAELDGAEAELLAPLAARASTLSSNDFGCENGDHPVEALLAPAGAGLAELLMDSGLLTPATVDDVDKLCRAGRKRMKLTDRLEALAPLEGWRLEILPGDRNDLKLGFFVLQLAPDVWGGVGPKLKRNEGFATPADTDPPAHKRAQDLLAAHCLRADAKTLSYKRGKQESGAETQVVVESSRTRCLSRLLTRSGVARVAPLNDDELNLFEGLDDKREILVGGDALYHRTQIANHAEHVVGVRTKVIWT